MERPVVVVGLARSGVAAAEFLARRGAVVVAADRKSEAELPEDALRLREKGVRLELGAHRAETFTGAAAGRGLSRRAVGAARSSRRRARRGCR